MLLRPASDVQRVADAIVVSLDLQSSLSGCICCIRHLRRVSGSRAGSTDSGTGVRTTSFSFHASLNAQRHSGSIVSIIGMPLTCMITRRNLNTVRAGPLARLTARY